jgi:fatty acid desaturase
LHPSKRVNNWLATWLIAAPCITEFERSQKRHLAHHQSVGQPEEDPDFPLYATAHPYAKKSLAEIVRHFMGRITGRKFASAVTQEKEQHHWWPVIAMQAAIFLAFSVTAGWMFYVLLWLVPLAGGAVLFNDIRIFCEHSNAGKDSTAPEDIMISYKSHPLELFFIAPNHMNYHAEHHLFPYVPHSRLPKLRALIQQTPELNDAIQWRTSYVGYMMQYVRSLKA